MEQLMLDVKPKELYKTRTFELKAAGGVLRSIGKVTCSEESFKVFRENWPEDHTYRESFYIMALSQCNEVIGMAQISSGGVAGTVVDPKIVFAYALNIPACSGIILAHNHPSGNLRPSDADRRITKKLKEAGSLLDMPVLDHIILAENFYYSLADHGEM